MDEPEVFILFLLLSTFIWFIDQLSRNDLSINMEIPVTFEYQSDKLIIENPLPKQFRVKVRGNGNILSKLYLANKAERLRFDIDLSPDNTHVEGDYLFNLLQKQLPEVQIISIHPDNVPLSFVQIDEKKVPVKLVSDIRFYPQYSLKDVILLSPDSVTVSGAASYLDTLAYIPTYSLSLENIRTTQKGTISLKKPPTRLAQISLSQVSYSFEVEEITEKSFLIPITLRNVPDSVDFFLFPDKTELSFQLGISNYKDVTQEMFEVMADFKKVNLATDSTITLHITKVPPMVKHLQLKPAKVSFLIQKKIVP